VYARGIRRCPTEENQIGNLSGEATEEIKTGRAGAANTDTLLTNAP